VSIRQRPPPQSAQPLDDGLDAPQLLVGAERRGARRVESPPMSRDVRARASSASRSRIATSGIRNTLAACPERIRACVRMPMTSVRSPRISGGRAWEGGRRSAGERFTGINLQTGNGQLTTKEDGASRHLLHCKLSIVQLCLSCATVLPMCGHGEKRWRFLFSSFFSLFFQGRARWLRRLGRRSAANGLTALLERQALGQPTT